LKPVICFEMLFPQLAPPEKMSRIAGQGFEYVEFWGWRDKDIPALSAACSREGMRVVNFSGHRRGSLVAEQTHDLFLKDLQAGIGTAQTLECGTLMLLSNQLTETGAVENSYPEIPGEQKYGNARLGLEKALELLPGDLQLVLEPLNTRIDHPGYWLSDMQTAAKLMEEINDPRLKVLCDLYHLGVMGADLAAVLKEHVGHIGYIHVADVPGRHEPGTGNIDWKSVLSVLADCGYDGYVGFEYSPEDDSTESLRRIRAFWSETFP
jgi:hydroxypyruvate isomerase